MDDPDSKGQIPASLYRNYEELKLISPITLHSLEPISLYRNYEELKPHESKDELYGDMEFVS